MVKLEQQGDGTYRWKEFNEGDQYFLGTHGGLVCLNPSDVDGIYIGVIKGRHRFVRERGGRFEAYSTELEAPVIFCGEGGDDGAGSPAVTTIYDGMVPHKGGHHDRVREKLDALGVDAKI